MAYRLILPRQRREVRLRLVVSDIDAALGVLENAAGRVRQRRPRRLWLKVSDEGRVRARVPSGSSRSLPPFLKGRVMADDSGVFLAGGIRESYSEVIVPRVFAFLTVFMAAVFAGLLASGQYTSPGVYVCGIGGILFGLLAHALKRLRFGSFAREANDLLTRLKHEALQPLLDPADRS
jgi:hypothetical protein